MNIFFKNLMFLTKNLNYFKYVKKALVLGFFINFCLGYGQQNSEDEMIKLQTAMNIKGMNIVPPSPEAASLGKYGNINNNLFNGLPQISVPLFNLTIGGLSLPINLSYNSSGFKPLESSTWLGMGWDLNLGGVITRTVRGLPDVERNYFNGSNKFHSGVLRNYGNDNLFDRYDYFDSVKKGVFETQPDHYNFNFMGYSGLFRITPDKKVIFKEKNNWKVEFLITDYPFSMLNSTGVSFFKITTDDGTLFEFSSVEFTHYQLDDIGEKNYFNNYREFNFPSTWYLTKITSTTKNETIIFNYTIYNPNFYIYKPNSSLLLANNMHSDNYSLTETRSITTNDRAIDLPRVQINKGVNEDKTYILNKHFVNNVELRKNNQLVYKIVIENLANQRLDIDHTKIKNEQQLIGLTQYAVLGNQSLQKIVSYRFYQSYFGEKRLNQPRALRLKLDSIRIFDKNSIGNNTFYQFDYFPLNQIPNSNPSQDYFGYYNGLGEVNSLFPNYLERYEGSIKGSDRSCNFEATIMGMLKRIYYPTKGFTEFEYEQNEIYDMDFRTQTYQNILMGGVRIKTITDYSSPESPVSKRSFKYTQLDDETKSSGKTTTNPTFIVEKSSINRHFPEARAVLAGGQLSASLEDYKTETSSISVGALVASSGSLNGYHLGYKRVEEIFEYIKKPENNGKEVSYFLINDDDYAGVLNGTLVTKEIYNYFGQLISKKEFTYEVKIHKELSLIGITIEPLSEQNNKTKLCRIRDVKNNIYFYDWFLPNESPDKSLNTVIQVKPCNDNRFQIYFGKNYAISDLLKLNFRPSPCDQTVITLKRSGYDNVTCKLYPTKLTIGTVDGEIIVPFFKYLKEVKETKNDYLNQQEMIFYKTIDYNDFNYPYKTTEYTGLGDSLVSIIKYTADFIGGVQDKILNKPSKKDKQNPSPSITSDNLNAIEEMKAIFSNNQLNFPIEELQYRVINGTAKPLVSGFAYQYNGNGQIVKGYKLKQANLSINNYKFLTINNLGFNLDPAFTLETIISYDLNGNIDYIRGPDLLYKHYLYAYKNTLPIAEIISSSPNINKNFNTSFLNTQTNSVNYNDALNAELTNSIVKNNSNSLINIFTYNLGVGLYSMQAPNLLKKHFIYDNFNRLAYITNHNKDIQILYNYNYGQKSQSSSMSVNSIIPSNWVVDSNAACQAKGNSYKFIYPKCELGVKVPTGGEKLYEFKKKYIYLCKYEYHFSDGTVRKFSVETENICPKMDPIGTKYFCNGEEYKLINGNCVLGQKVYLHSEGLLKNRWECWYKYTWSDGTSSEMKSEISYKPCTGN